MSKLPEPVVSPTLAAIDRAYEEMQGDGWRPHLGASILGNECERALWFTFRWASRTRHTGRLLRLFERGQMEEDRFIEMLGKAGVHIHHYDIETGEQHRVSACDGHAGGSMDGVAIGFPEAPKTLHVVEMKTHNDKSFKELQKKGVKESKPLHWAQMQIYMYLGHIERAAYLAVNKNTDDLYMERVYPDPAAAIRLIEKAERIIKAPRPPAGISTDPCFYLCKWCDHAKTCHDREGTPRNCRTCFASSPVEDGQWRCSVHDKLLTVEEQRAGCPSQRFIPELVAGTQEDAAADGSWIAYEMRDGTTWLDEGP